MKWGFKMTDAKIYGYVNGRLEPVKTAGEYVQLWDYRLLQQENERLTREECATHSHCVNLQAENQRLITALHDCIRRPMGVVPDSADEWYTYQNSQLAEARRLADQDGGSDEA